MKKTVVKEINPHFNASQKRALAIATAVCIIFGAWFLRGYFSMFVIACTMAYLFNPVYIKLKKRMSDGKARLLTILISFLAIIIPLTIVLILAGTQIKNLASGATEFFANFDSTEFSVKVIDFINSILALSPIHIDPITSEQVVEWLQAIGKEVGSALVNFFAETASSFIGWFTSFIVYLFVFISLIKNGPSLIEMFRKINPLGEEVSDIYLRKSGAMIKGTVFGQLVIAMVQGFGGAVSFAIAGYPELFFVVFIIFTLLSIIPLGAGILQIPLGILIALFGNVWGGVIIVAEHLLINTNVDNVLRPILVPKTAKLDAALMIVSVFSGIALFGFLGIIVGPTIMILIVTTVRLYLEEFKSYKPVDNK